MLSGTFRNDIHQQQTSMSQPMAISSTDETGVNYGDESSLEQRNLDDDIVEAQVFL